MQSELNEELTVTETLQCLKKMLPNSDQAPERLCGTARYRGHGGHQQAGLVDHPDDFSVNSCGLQQEHVPIIPMIMETSTTNLTQKTCITYQQLVSY